MSEVETVFKSIEEYAANIADLVIENPSETPEHRHALYYNLLNTALEAYRVNRRLKNDPAKAAKHLRHAYLTFETAINFTKSGDKERFLASSQARTSWLEVKDQLLSEEGKEALKSEERQSTPERTTPEKSSSLEDTERVLISQSFMRRICNELRSNVNGITRNFSEEIARLAWRYADKRNRAFEKPIALTLDPNTKTLREKFANDYPKLNKNIIATWAYLVYQRDLNSSSPSTFPAILRPLEQSPSPRSAAERKVRRSLMKEFDAASSSK